MTNASIQHAIEKFISRHCSSLQKIALINLCYSDESFFPVEMILSGCPLLSELVLCCADMRYLKGFTSLPFSIGGHRPCYNIRRLKLKSLGCYDLRLLQCCPNLQELEIKDSSIVSNDVFDVLQNYCPKMWRLIIINYGVLSIDVLDEYSASTGVKVICCP